MPTITANMAPRVTVMHPEQRELSDHEEFNGWMAADKSVEVRGRGTVVREGGGHVAGTWDLRTPAEKEVEALRRDQTLREVEHEITRPALAYDSGSPAAPAGSPVSSRGERPPGAPRSARRRGSAPWRGPAGRA